MYSRSYLGNGDGRPALPENYDGVAFLEAETPGACIDKPENSDIKASIEPSIITNEKHNKNPWENQPEKPQSKPATEESAFAGFGKLPFLNGLSGIFRGKGSGGFSLSKIGTEEILIIAAAVFLFFSKDGDNECAIMLLLLLLIN